MKIKIDDLRGSDIAQLLNDHLQSLSALSPPESMHALDLDGLRQPGITFWSVWEGEELLGCGALKELDAQHAEIKSMRTVSATRPRELLQSFCNTSSTKRNDVAIAD